MPDVFGRYSWPGVASPDSLTYTLSQGISPGAAVLTTLPQLSAPAETGTLVFGDGINGTITLPDCKVDKITSRRSGDGFLWTITVMDRRWKWKDLGQISGCYNQLDSRGKLIPRTIQSPTELAVLCLQAMGETRYVIDLPPGTTHQEGLDAAEGLKPDYGLTPETGTNPPVNWVQETPACALDRLCQQYGRVVVYRWSDDSVLIARPGVGDMLPSRGSIAVDAPGLDSPEVPTGVAVAGNPTRYQVRLLLEAVGRDWDGHYRPIDQLTYRPKPATSKTQKVKFTFVIPADASAEFNVYLGPADGSSPVTSGVTFTYDSSAGESPTSVATALAALINASTDPTITDLGLTASVGGTGLTAYLVVESNTVATLFSYTADASSASTSAAVSFLPTQTAEDSAGRWWYSCPPTFASVVATDRLTKIEAMRLAQESVFRCYRIKDIGVQPAEEQVDENGDPVLDEFGDPIETPPPIVVQGYGEIRWRQQLIIEPTQVELIRPEPIDQTLKDAAGNPMTVNYYNGYAHDKPATCYGRLANALTWGTGYFRTTANNGTLNGGPTDQILIPFSVDPNEQVITFANHVYCVLAAGAIDQPPRLILQCAVTVRNQENHAQECYALSELLPNQSGLTNYAVRKYPDVQRNIVGDYATADDDLIGSHDLEQDYKVRAQYYLSGLKAQYLWETSQYREWNGIELLDLDGAIMQVTWSIGPSGCKTTASRNSEHSVNVPPFTARRRNEFLAPAQQQAIQQGANPPLVNVNGSQNTPDN
jgi:hypothetical protein